MNRKAFAFASLLIILSLVLSSCATPTPEVVEKIVKEVVTEVVEVEKEVTRMVEGTPVVEEIIVTEVVEMEVTKVVEVEVETVVTATPAPMSELATTLVAAVNGAPWNMDPVFSNDSWIDRQLVNMYDPLVNFAPVTGELVPWLAEEWDISDDGLTYTFKIREGVKFHDGTDLTASDVKYTFDRLQALKEGVFFELTHFDSAEMVDDYTVKLHMKVPSEPFSNSLPKFLIVSEDGAKAVEVDGDWGMGANDLGSGPYMLERLEPEQEYVYAKFDDYWQEWPENHVEKIIWRIVKEAATQRLLLEKGDIDIAMEPAVEDLPALEDNPDIVIYEDVSAQQMYFHLRMHHPPLDDVRVRKALAIGYDYDAHIESILGGHGQQARGPLPLIYPENDESIELPVYDPDAARAMLADAGYPDGFTMKVVYDPGSEYEKLRGFELWQIALEDLGITVEPLAMDWDTMTANEADEDSEPDAYVEYYWPSALDADGSMRQIYHSDSRGGYNASWYSNPEVDRLMDAALQETDDKKRTEMWHQIQQLVNDDQPSIFVSNPGYFIAARDWVKGYVYNVSHHQGISIWGMSLEGKP